MGENIKYRIEELGKFGVVGVMRPFNNGNGYSEVPALWDKFNASEQSNIIKGKYGVLTNLNDEICQYTIADDYTLENIYMIPDDCVAFIIEEHTWAVFEFKGKIPEEFQALDKRIWAEWDSIMSDYIIDNNMYIEKYDTGNDNDAEIWMPVRKK